MFTITSGFVELNPAFRDYEERSNKINEVLKKMRAENKFSTLKGWRDEVILRLSIVAKICLKLVPRWKR